MTTDLDKECKLLFNKRYSFPDRSDYRLPSSSSTWFQEKWEIDRLKNIKNRLNSVKSKLNDVDLNLWHKHTKAQNPADFILFRLGRTLNVELMTQAWCKLTEILNQFRFFERLKDDKDEEIITSLHLCEAPGAFISGLNYHLKTKNVKFSQWKWKAVSLNPFYEGNDDYYMINDDRFILKTLENWDFFLDNTGDIMKLGNASYLMTHTHRQMDFITADGSFNCQFNPAEQEDLVVNLHYIEVIVALAALKKSGNLVVKMFTFFESSSVCLLYLLRCVFRRLSVFKPCTSKEGNSEVYVIAEGFKGMNYDELSELSAKFFENRQNRNLFRRRDLPDFFVDCVIECANYFADWQIRVIERNLDSFHTGCDMTELQAKVANEFWRLNSLSPLRNKDKIFRTKLRPLQFSINMDTRRETGTFLDKIKKETDEEILVRIKTELQNSADSNREIVWIVVNPMKEDEEEEEEEEEEKNDDDDDDDDELTPVYGKPFEFIHNSKFGRGSLLKLYYETLSLVDFRKPKHNKIDEEIKLLWNGDDSKYWNTIRNYIRDFENADIALLIIPVIRFIRRETCHEFKIDLVKSLINVFRKHEENDHKRPQHVVLVGFPSFSRYNVAVLYILSSVFRTMGFVRPDNVTDDIIILIELKQSERHKLIRRLIEIREMIERESDSKCLLELLPIKYLLNNPFYLGLFRHNVANLREKTLNLLCDT